MCSIWKELQQADGQRAEKLTGERWSKKMVCILFGYNHALWKSSCEIVHLENKETLEKRKRKQLQNLRDKLLKKLVSTDRHLLQRDNKFFNNDTM